MRAPEDPILVVDDEPDILDLVRFHLEEAGFRVTTAASGSEALERLKQVRPCLLLLDIMLPDLSGTELLRHLRGGDPAVRAVPVILLTARRDEVDRVVGFELGADDYVTKPFSPRELVLRVRAVLRRASGEPEQQDQLVRGCIRLDRSRHQCVVDGDEVALTAKEFGLLEMLIERPGRVFSRGQLLDRVWGGGIHVTPRTIDTHVKRLREKLGKGGALISTIRGVGYRLDA
jgi:two-component system phosphate regulon response regulator PhoB